MEERIDTGSAVGELTFHIFAVLSHFERRLISERTKDGLAAARKQGWTPGHPALPQEAALKDMMRAGQSVSQTARHLWIGRSTAYKLVGGTDL